jgi:hypothetical protein
MSARQVASKAYMLLGQVVPCVKQNASKIRIRRMELDTNLNMVHIKNQNIISMIGNNMNIILSVL